MIKWDSFLILCFSMLSDKYGAITQGHGETKHFAMQFPLIL